ncbi:MAG TPA: hypothetical protein VF281_04465 [Candidatus Saccharimonadales bacterium]
MITISPSAIKRHAWAFPFELVMMVSLVLFVWTGRHDHFGLTLFLLVSCMALPLIEHIWRLRLSPVLHGLYVAFLFASMFAGEVLDMYAVVSWWDDGLHLISGILVGLGAAVWLQVLEQRKAIRSSVWMQVVIVIALGALIAVAWELVEFAADQWFGTFMQRNDLFDTMTDFIYGMLGTIIAATLFGRYLRQRHSWGIGRLLERQRWLND